VQTYYSIQALRAIAAGLVVIFHAHQDAQAQNWVRTFSLQDYIFGIGEAGVHVFFVISGFVMMFAGFGRGNFNIRSFLMRRAVRIYPLYWMVMAFALILFAMIGRYIPVTPLEFVGVLLLWPDLAPRYISPAWTLTFEVYFYLCFALAMTLGRNRGMVALTVFFVLMVGLRPFINTENAILDLMTNGLLIEFLFGSAIGLLAIEGRLPRTIGPSLGASAVVLFVAGLGLDREALPKAVLWGVPSVLLIAGVVSWETNGKLPRVFTALAPYGDGSYMLYLLHKPLQWGLLALFVAIMPGAGVNALLWTVTISIACFILCEIGHRRLEKPMLVFLRTRSSNSQPLPA